MGHTVSYSGIWLFAIIFLMGIKMDFMPGNHYLYGFPFALVTFLAHTITDYITSREVKKLFDKEDYHNGFVIIGIDQFLHYVQLFLTYKWVTGWL